MFTFKKFFVSLGFIALAGLMSGCSDREEIIAKKVDVKFYNQVRGYYPENCTRIQFRHTNDFFCRLILNKADDKQLRFQVEFNYNQINQFYSMTKAAFLSYIEDEIVNTNDKIKDCEIKSGTRILFCDKRKIDVDKLYWSIFNPIYVKEAYGCDLKNNIFDSKPTILCDGKEVSKVELAVGSFFDAARGLMLTDNEKNLWLDIFMKKELNEKDFELFSNAFKIKHLSAQE